MRALHHAAKSDSNQIIKLLLDHNAEVAPLDIKMMTPLHYAAEGGHVASTKTLLSYKAPVDNIGTRDYDKQQITVTIENAQKVGELDRISIDLVHAKKSKNVYLFHWLALNKILNLV